MSYLNGCITEKSILKDAIINMTSGVTVIVDNANELKGIITLGDVSKALNDGCNLSTPVENIMNKTPFCLSFNEVVKKNKIWANTDNRKKIYIPIVDNDGKFLYLEHFYKYLETQEVLLYNKKIVTQLTNQNITINDNLKYLFITGSPKSGTTWLRNILDGHCEIELAEGEGHLFTRYYKSLLKFRDRCNENRYSPFKLDDALMIKINLLVYRNLLNGLAKDKKELKFVGEKTPQYCQKVKQIYNIFPDSFIIHIIRDGRDVVVSDWFNYLQNLSLEDKNFKLDDGHLHVPDEFVEPSITHWIENIRAIKRDIKFFPDSNYFEIKYEELHENEYHYLKKILLFLDVSVEENDIISCMNAGEFEKHSGKRKRGQESLLSFYRKGIVGDHKNYLSEKQLTSINNIAGFLLEELNYN